IFVVPQRGAGGRRDRKNESPAAALLHSSSGDGFPAMEFAAAIRYLVHFSPRTVASRLRDPIRFGLASQYDGVPKLRGFQASGLLAARLSWCSFIPGMCGRTLALGSKASLMACRRIGWSGGELLGGLDGLPHLHAAAR